MDIVDPNQENKVKLVAHLKNILLRVDQPLEEDGPSIQYDFNTAGKLYYNNFELLRRIIELNVNIDDPYFYEIFNNKFRPRVRLTEETLIQYIIYNVSRYKSFQIREGFVSQLYNLFGVESSNLNSSISLAMGQIMDLTISKLATSRYRLHPAFSMKGGKLLNKHLRDLQEEYKSLAKSNDDELDVHSLELKQKIQYLEPIVKEWMDESMDSDFDSGVAVLEIVTPQQILTTSVFEYLLQISYFPANTNQLVLSYLFKEDPLYRVTINCNEFIQPTSTDPIVIICNNILTDLLLCEASGYEVMEPDAPLSYEKSAYEVLEKIRNTISTKIYVNGLTEEEYNPYMRYNSIIDDPMNEEKYLMVNHLFPERSVEKLRQYNRVIDSITKKFFNKDKGRIWRIYHTYQRFCKCYYLFTILSRYLLDTARPNEALVRLHRQLREPILYGYSHYAHGINPDVPIGEFLSHFKASYAFIFEGENKEAEMENMNRNSTQTEIEYRQSMFFTGRYKNVDYDVGKKIEADFKQIANWKAYGYKAVHDLFATRIPYYNNQRVANVRKDNEQYDLNECIRSTQYEYFYNINSFIINTSIASLFEFLPNLVTQLSEPFRLINNNKATQFNLNLVFNKLKPIFSADTNPAVVRLSQIIQTFQDRQPTFCEKVMFVPSNQFSYQLKDLEQSMGAPIPPHSLLKGDMENIMQMVTNHHNLDAMKGVSVTIHQRSADDLYTIIRLMFKYDILYKKRRYVCTSPMTNAYLSTAPEYTGLNVERPGLVRPIYTIPYSPFDSELIDITFHNGENHTDYHLYHQSRRDGPTLPYYLSLAGVFFDYMNMFGTLRSVVDKHKKRCDRLYRSLAVFLTYDKKVMLEVQYLSSANSVAFNPMLLDQCEEYSSHYSDEINQILTTQLTSNELTDTVFKEFVNEPSYRESLPLFRSPFALVVKGVPYTWDTLSSFQKINYKKVIDKLNSQPIKAKLTELVLNSIQPNSSSPYGEAINFQLYPFLSNIENENFSLYIKGGAMWRQYIREKLNPSLPDTEELIQETRTISDCDAMIVANDRLIVNGQLIYPYTGNAEYEKQVNSAMYIALFNSLLNQLPTLVRKLKRLRPDESVFARLADSIMNTYNSIEPCTVSIRYNDRPIPINRISYTHILNNNKMNRDPTNSFEQFFQLNKDQIAAVLQSTAGTNLKLKFFVIENTTGEKHSKFYLFRIVGVVTVTINDLVGNPLVSGLYEYEILDISSDEMERRHTHKYWDSTLGIKILDIDWFITDNFTIFSENHFSKPEKRCKRYQQLMKIICQLNLYDQTEYDKRKGLDLLSTFAATKKQFLTNLQQCLGTKCSELFSDLIILVSGHEEDKIDIVNRWKLYCNCVQGEDALPTMYKYKMEDVEWLKYYLSTFLQNPRYFFRVINLSLIPNTDYALIDFSFIKSLYDAIMVQVNNTSTMHNFKEMVFNYLRVQEYYNFNDPRGFTSYYKIGDERFTIEENGPNKVVYLDDEKEYENESLNETLLMITRSIQQTLPHNHPAPTFDTVFSIYCMKANDYSPTPLSLSSLDLQDDNLQKLWDHIIVRNHLIFPKSMYDNYLDRSYHASITSTDALQQLIQSCRTISVALPSDNEWVWMRKDSMYGSAVALIGDKMYGNKLVPSDGDNPLFYTYLNYCQEDVAEPLVPSTYCYNVSPNYSTQIALPQGSLRDLCRNPLPEFWLRGSFKLYGYLRNQFSHEVVKSNVATVHLLHLRYIQAITDQFRLQIPTLVGWLSTNRIPFTIQNNILGTSSTDETYFNRIVQLDYYLSLDKNQVIDIHQRKTLQDRLSISLPALSKIAQKWSDYTKRVDSTVPMKEVSRLFQLIWWMNQHITHKSKISMVLINVLCFVLISRDISACKEFQKLVPFSITQQQASLFMMIHALLPKGQRYSISILYELLDKVFILDETSYQSISSNLQQEEVLISQFFYHPVIIHILNKQITYIESETNLYLAYKKNLSPIQSYLRGRPYTDLIWTDDLITKTISRSKDNLYALIQEKIERRRIETRTDHMDVVSAEEVKEKENSRASIIRNENIMEVEDPVPPTALQVDSYQAPFAQLPIYAIASRDALPMFYASAPPNTIMYTYDPNNPNINSFFFKNGSYITPQIQADIMKRTFPVISSINEFRPLARSLL